MRQEWVDRVTAGPVFAETATAYMVLDSRFRIRAVNRAYERASGYGHDVLVGEDLFAVFPDNPADPGADGVANLSGSLESVLSTGQRHHLAAQRYDVADPSDRTAFSRRVWTVVNSPLCGPAAGDGGVLHAVQEITHLLGDAAEPRLAASPGLQPGAVDGLVALQEENAQLRVALDTNRDIGAAVGVVMHGHRLDYDEAFALLRKISQNLNWKLHDLAQAVMDARDLPLSDDHVEDLLNGSRLRRSGDEPTADVPVVGPSRS